MYLSWNFGSDTLTVLAGDKRSQSDENEKRACALSGNHRRFVVYSCVS